MKERLIKLQEEYAELNKEGLIGISERCIQVLPRLFKKIADLTQVTTEENHGYIELHYIDADGVDFLTLINTEEPLQ